MRLERTSVTAAAGVMALSALVGTSSASPAAAAAPAFTHLCVDRNGESLCAWANGSEQPVAVRYEPSTGTSTTNWVYPTTNGGSGQISQAHTTLCMQINHDGGDVVREAPCADGGTPEMWKNQYVGGRTEFLSVWADAYYGTQMCLTWQDNLAGSEAYVLPCADYGAAYNGWGKS
jgi:hypothetical protein